MNDISDSLRNQVMSRIDPTDDLEEEDILRLIDEVITCQTNQGIVGLRARVKYRQQIFNDIKRLDILQELIDDDSVTEIMVNGWDTIFLEKNGRIHRWDKHFASPQRLNDIVQRIAAQSNKIINESVPISDTRLKNGSRVNVVMNPVAINGPIITIRKFYNNPLSMEKMIQLESISEGAAQFLRNLVIARYNIFISGGTSSGKTSFLNALSNYIPSEERVITIEDSAELKLMNIDNLVRLEARNANIEGRNAVTIRELIKSALRMRPDRIIVGEVRGGEAIDMITAMNTGHDGSISTGHANSAEDMMSRLETMVLMAMDMPVSAIRNQIAAALDIVVHLGRLRDRTRRVLSLSEVLGMGEDNTIKLNRLYEFTEKGVDADGRIIGSLRRTSSPMYGQDKLKQAGIKGEICV